MLQRTPREGADLPELGRGLEAFIERTIGAPISAVDLSWEHGESAVWRVTSAGHQAVLKVYRQGRKFANELAAYTQWAPALRTRLEAGTAVPALLGVHAEHPRALLLGWEPGELAENLTLSAPGEQAVHRRAGRFLRALHDLPVETVDTLPLPDAYRARLDAWTARTRGTVPAAVREAVAAEAAKALPFIEGSVRAPCHRDFTPRNWLGGSTEQDGPATQKRGSDGCSLVVIDFEHSRPDLYLADLQRLWVGLWRRRPDLKASFLTGYGRDLSAEEEGALRRLSALWALSTVGWAREHDDREFEETGWEALRWIGLA